MDGRTTLEPEEANRLYWASDKGVNQLAEELGVSKGMLYNAIQPKPSGLRCIDCQAQLVYANRTALERSMLSCPSCGTEVPEREAKLNLWEGKTTPAIPEPRRPATVSSDAASVDVDAERESVSPARSPLGGTRSVIGAAAVLVGIGVWIGRRLR